MSEMSQLAAMGSKLQQKTKIQIESVSAKKLHSVLEFV